MVVKVDNGEIKVLNSIIKH